MRKHRLSFGLALSLVLVGSFFPFSPAPPFAAEPHRDAAGPSSELERVAERVSDEAQDPAAVDRYPRPVPGRQVLAVYPEHLREARVEGRVILQALIDATGHVGEVTLLRTTQPEYPELAEAAITAVRQWRYEPAARDGQPVEAHTTVIMEFSLDAGDGQDGDDDHDAADGDDAHDDADHEPEDVL